MNNEPIAHLEKLIAEARPHLEESQTLLNNVLNDAEKIENLSIEDQVSTLQLVLQYRLSCENVLNMLMQLDHNLLYFLGLQPQQSAKMNIDRLSYAVGSEDLKQLLSILAILVGSLSKIAGLYKYNHASFALHERQTRQRTILIRDLTKLTAKHKQFATLVAKIQVEMEALLKLEAIGPVLDHVAALRGPISQFHQALLNGLGKSEALYHKLNKNAVLEDNLSHLIKQAENVLRIMPTLYKPAPLSKLKEPQSTAEQLEQRATAKRLRPFFW